MDEHSGPINAFKYLYPPIEPFQKRMLSVSDGHEIYYEQVGNPSGLPVVVLHGGPGGGCNSSMRRYFNPKIYRVILFDQRGCGRSRPHSSTEFNTTWHLVDDMERIRIALDIDSWIVFGGSWGATLGLIYAQSYPHRVKNLVLRGVFAMTQDEIDWFYAGGAGRFMPEQWRSFQSVIPREERDDMIEAYHRRLFSGNTMEESLYSYTWTRWESALATIRANENSGNCPNSYARAFARIECHYFKNGGFLETDGHIYDNIDKIADISGVIVQGRYDLICPPSTAFRLSELWRKARLIMVPLAGHALSEPGITAELVKTMDALGKG
ncbi:MAG: prolyl aminopeptidase [Roseovarius sp.]|nr:prolyl aminopeptidase [Roseovarius sp.]